MTEQDPYKKGITDSVSDSLSPSFYKPSSNSLNNLENSASHISANAQSNTKGLGLSNANASDDKDKPNDSSTDQAAAAEANPTGLYNPNGQNGNDKTTAAADFAKNMASGSKLKALKSAKKVGPLGVLLVMLIVAGALLMGSSGLAPFAIANEIISEFNSSNVSVRLRSHVLLKYHLKNGDTPEYTKKKLAAQGIDVETDDNGKEQLRFTDSDGKEHVVTADNFDDYRKTNTDFKKAYTTASATWRGQSSGWFTKLASKTLKRIGVSRNNLKDATNDDKSTTEEKKKKLQETVESAGGSDTDSKMARSDGAEEDDDGNQKAGGAETDSNDSPTRKDSLSSARTKIGSSVAKINGGGSLAGGACGVLMAASAVKGIVYASQHAEMLQIASIFLESVQKTQAGEGEAAMLNTFMMALTDTDDDHKTSAMQSAGISALFSGSSNSTTNYKNNSGVKLANSNNVITEAMTVGGVDVGSSGNSTYAQCLAARAGSAVVDVITTATGPFKAIMLVVDIGVQIAAEAAIGTIINAAAEAITVNVVGNLLGENMGNYIVSGAQSYLGSIHQGQGGAAGSAEAVAEYQTAKQELIAEQAEYERSIYSPFDTSSQYTFLGNILNNLIPLATSISSSSVGSTLSQASSVLSSSLISLTPAVDAANLTNLMQETGDCPDLESVGATCDMYGNPIYVSDLDTIEEDPQAIEDKVNSLKSNGNYEKWQSYCEQRSSILGTSDSEIIADLTSSDSIASQIVSVLPILGSLQEIKDVALESANIGWTTGQYCVDSSDNDLWNSEMKYYQRYDEDQELEKQMNGEFSTSSSDDDSSDGIYSGTKYDYDDDTLKQLAAIAACENGGSVDSVKLELSLMANLYEQHSGYSDILDYVKTGGWFASKSVACASNTDGLSDEYFQAAVDVIRNGNRTAPAGINEHDYIGDIAYIELDGERVDINDINNYVKDKTVIHNEMGSTYTFWTWANPNAASECDSAGGSCSGDPFGYTGSSSGATSSLDSDLDDYELSNIIAYNPSEESSSDYYLAYDDDGNLSIEYYEDESTISDADGDGYDDDYVAQIASYSGLSTAEVVETLDLLYSSDDSDDGTAAPAWPLASTNFNSANQTPDFTSNAPLATQTAAANYQFFLSTNPTYARTDFATTTA